MPWRILAGGTLQGLSDATLRATLTPMPRFFMTGDGHRQPPFGWTNACKELRGHFMMLMASKMLCAHVEEHQEKVKDTSVPTWFFVLYDQRRIFGWELTIYKDLGPVMEKCMELMAVVGRGRDLSASVIKDIVALDREMSRVQKLLSQVGNPSGFQNVVVQSAGYKRYFEGISKKSYYVIGQPKPRQPAIEEQYIKFLLGYHTAAMSLRTKVNRYIGNNIQRIINQYPNCTHIITCGNAHITTDPLAQYITLPNGAEGVVDPYQN